MEKMDNISPPRTATLSSRRKAESAASADPLSDRLPAGVLLPYLLTGVALAMAYGSSFLLADMLSSAGYGATGAGTVVSIGIFATLAGSLFAGHLAERAGIMSIVAASAAIMTGAMACFMSTASVGVPMAYLGGVLLGLGWALFYMLAPIQIIHCLKPNSRLEALTMLSGSQMLGIGISAPLGRLIAQQLADPFAAYAFYGIACAIATLAALAIRPRLRTLPQMPMKAIALSWPAALLILRGSTLLPVVMMGISACTFAGLSIFQTLYARSRGLTPDAFFLTFTVTTVALRFSVASLIGRLPLGRLAGALFVTTLLGIALLDINRSSLAVYIAASVLFAIGYGLTYSTLNAMVVNLAEEKSLSVPIASQVFTLGYFVGLFGFPYIAGRLISMQGINTALEAMMGLIAINVLIAFAMARQSGRLTARRLASRGAG